NGNGLNQQPSPTTYFTGANWNRGIEFVGNNNLVQNSTIYNIRAFAIDTAWGVATNGNGVVNCKIYDVGANGLTAGTTGSGETDTGTYFINNEVYACSDVGISAQGYNTIITGNNVHDCDSTSAPMYGTVNSYWGIAVENGGGTGNGNYLLIAKNTITNAGNGLLLAGAYSPVTYTIISGNTVTNGDLEG